MIGVVWPWIWTVIWERSKSKFQVKRQAKRTVYGSWSAVFPRTPHFKPFSLCPPHKGGINHLLSKPENKDLNNQWDLTIWAGHLTTWPEQIVFQGQEGQNTFLGPGDLNEIITLRWNSNIKTRRDHHQVESIKAKPPADPYKAQEQVSEGSRLSCGFLNRHISPAQQQGNDTLNYNRRCTKEEKTKSKRPATVRK